MNDNELALYYANFDSREGYLRLRDEWRKAYGDLSKTIRLVRADARHLMRKDKYAGAQQQELVSLRVTASVMMEARTLMKQEAAKQRAEARSVPAA